MSPITRISFFVLALIAVLGMMAQSSARQASAALPDAVPGAYIVGFASPPGAADEALVRAAGGKVTSHFDIIPAMAVNLPGPAVNALARNPRVAYVEPDYIRTPRDYASELAATWGVARIGAGSVHTTGATGAGVKVAIIDTGVTCGHLDLGGSCAASLDFSTTPPTVLSTTANNDEYGHGTHVAGTVGARRNGAGVVGVAPEVNIYSLRVCDANGSCPTSRTIAAMQWAAANGIDIANMSLGSRFASTAERAAADAASTSVVLVAAAGNSGNCAGNNDSVEYPGGYASVIAVAATNSSDARACFSSTGPAVELSAPGVAVPSTWTDGAYYDASGTSMATPHVAGVAALVIGANPTLETFAVRSILQGTATDLGAAGRDTKYGFGLVNAAAALGVVPPPPATGSIAGIVTDSSTDLPVSGATISVDTGQSANTQADGGYTLTGVTTGSRTLTVSAPGYATKLVSGVVVSENATTTASIALDPVPEGSAASVSAITYATSGGKDGKRHLTVTIAVKDGAGNGLAGASVSGILANATTGGSWTLAGTTGSAGTVAFTLSNAPKGAYVTTITGVALAGYTWDGATPANAFTK